ncbi:MAG: pyridoxamine 5'-phosphate oxidase [Micrococcales bacterium]|nr:pyridoxamine 5'-phosphate oxidase [Micrococcales bacterium]
MSIPVDLAQLAAVLEAYGSAYLLTTGPDGRVKVVTVDPAVEGELIRVPGCSGGTARNLGHNPAASLVWAPLERHGYTLIVDGTAATDAQGFVLTPEHAVLHRPSAHSDGPPAPGAVGESQPTGCGEDCHPL